MLERLEVNVHYGQGHESASKFSRLSSRGLHYDSPTRMAGRSINTVMKLLVNAGEACVRQHETVRGLASKRPQLGKIFSGSATRRRITC